MTAANHLLILASTTTKTKGSPITMVILIAALGGFWYFFLRPRRKAMREQQAKAKTFGVGDEIMTIGGVIGVVVDVAEDRFTLRTGGAEQGAEIVFLKQSFKAMAPAKPEPPTAALDEADESAGEDTK